ASCGRSSVFTGGGVSSAAYSAAPRPFDAIIAAASAIAQAFGQVACDGVPGQLGLGLAVPAPATPAAVPDERHASAKPERQVEDTIRSLCGMAGYQSRRGAPTDCR